MPSGVLTPVRRDGLRLAIALALLAGPLWVPALHLDDRTYQYERAEVVFDGEEGLRYADSDDPSAAISEDIACSGTAERVCAFERFVAGGNTISSGWYTNNPGVDHDFFPQAGIHYRYAAVNGTVYDLTLTANESVTNARGMHRLDLALEPADTERALDAVSLNATRERDRDRAPAVVFEAAREGSARSPEDVELPKQPVKLANGSYYRVYRTGFTDPNPVPAFLGTVLPYVTPIVGLCMLYGVSSRFEVSHVSENERE